MSGMVRVGRGGAGNFISQKDIQEAEKVQNNNVSQSFSFVLGFLPSFYFFWIWSDLFSQVISFVQYNHLLLIRLNSFSGTPKVDKGKDRSAST